MLRFLLIFFALATVLLSLLVVRSGRITASFLTDNSSTSPLEEKVTVIPDGRVQFTVTPQPVQAMKPLLFQVTVHNDREPQSVLVDLSMPDMYMGINQVTMRKSSPGVYEGVGIIPICPSGLKLWQASVIIDHQVTGNYYFDVQY